MKLEKDPDNVLVLLTDYPKFTLKIQFDINRLEDLRHVLREFDRRIDSWRALRSGSNR